MRRMFHRWLSAAKTSRHRRLVLQEREEELRMNLLEKAWDKWREKFKAERLRPLVGIQHVPETVWTYSLYRSMLCPSSFRNIAYTRRSSYGMPKQW